MAEIKHETICVLCGRKRLVTRSMIYFIKIGKSTGKCKSCSSTGHRRRFGFTCSKETKDKMSVASIGRKKSLQHCKNIGIGRAGIKILKTTGENHYLWKKDRTIIMEKHRLRGTIEWRIWREFIFNRDNYTCKECNKRGVKLEPHHIIPLKKDISKVFDKNNGITLCVNCHKKTIRKEDRFEQKYFSLLKP